MSEHLAYNMYNVFRMRATRDQCAFWHASCAALCCDLLLCCGLLCYNNFGPVVSCCARPMWMTLT